MSPEAYGRALRHQEAAARDYEAAAMIYGSPFRSVRARYSGNSHQRRKQRRAQMATCLRLCPGCSWCGTDPGDRKDGRWTECDGSGVLPARKAKR